MSEGKNNPYHNYSKALKAAKNHVMERTITFKGNEKADAPSAALLNYHLAKSMNWLTVVLILTNLVSLFLLWKSFN